MTMGSAESKPPLRVRRAPLDEEEPAAEAVEEPEPLAEVPVADADEPVAVEAGVAART